MIPLHPFRTEPSHSAIELRGEAELRADGLHLNFEVKDPNTLIVQQLNDQEWSESSASREDGLWQHTCYEAFWALPGQNAYWELNLSPKGAWNLYHFKGYRNPQPPQAASDFELLRLSTSSGVLRAHLGPRFSLAALEFSLCAVLKTKNSTSYHSTRHAGDKPDFHLRDSMDLHRSFAHKG